MGKRVLTRLGAGMLCWSMSSVTWAIQASIEGLEGEVADNVRYYLADIDESQYSRTRLESEIQRLSREAMRVFGYYEPTIVLDLIGEDPPVGVQLSIDPGPRVRIEVMDFRLEGDANQDDSFQAVIADFPLEVGDPLIHAPYDRLRGRLANLSLERGYFDWRFIDRRMEVRPYDQSARLYLALDSGTRYRFGEVNFGGSHIEEDRLRTMQPFSSGEPYLAAEIARYNQLLGQTNWFSSVTVRPRLSAAEGLALPEAPTGFWTELDVEADFATLETESPRLSQMALEGVSALHHSERTEVPIDVSFTPADRHQFEVGVGFATDVGPRTRFAWNQPWINRRGHGLDNSIYLSGPEQRLTGEYTLPLANPLRDSYRFQYGFRQRNSEDTKSLEATVEAARRWEFDNGWIQRLYLRSTLEDFTQGSDSEQVWLLYPGVSWSRTRTRNPTFPTWGDRQRIAFEVSDGHWGSSADFLRMTGDTQWIRMFADDTRFITRLGLGAIETSDFRKIPPSLRFFTGGDRSIRGYAFETLAPRNDQGDLRGGQQLLTTSAELQRRVTGDWWGAAFIDTGDAFDDWGPNALSTGAGLGVRWVSPVGPIRLDIAHPFDDEDNSWRLHFAIGPEF